MFAYPLLLSAIPFRLSAAWYPSACRGVAHSLTLTGIARLKASQVFFALPMGCIFNACVWADAVMITVDGGCISFHPSVYHVDGCH